MHISDHGFCYWGTVGMQLADISDWGSLADVSRLILPTGVRVRSAEVETIQRPPRDTRTIRGVVETPPLNIYKCGPPLLRAQAAMRSCMPTSVWCLGVLVSVSRGRTARSPAFEVASSLI